MNRIKNSILVGFLVASAAKAGVNVNNGNFYVTYTDFVVFTPGLPIEISRTYNSRSNFIPGKFGVGWSSELDSYIKFENKDIVYLEGGGGNVLKFTPKGMDIWENNVLGPQYIKKSGKVAKSFMYNYQGNTGKNLVFNNIGQLIKLQDGNKNYVEFSYEKSSLKTIKDNFNNQIMVSTKEYGGFSRVESIKYNGKKSTYSYTKSGDLIKATTMDGARYDYSYDDEHNMTKIAYGNGSSKMMEYNKIRDWITKFKDVDGSTIAYDYFTETLDPENKFGTIVARKDSTGKEDKAQFWYEFRKKKDGTRFAYRTISTFNTDATESLLTECCGTPLSITQWLLPSVVPNPAKNLSWTQPTGKRSTTRFEYYADGSLKKKILPNGSAISIAYDPLSKKIASLDRAGSKVEYSYDAKQNLASAKDLAEKLQLDFTYDIQGRITIVKESPINKLASVRKLFFKYNNDGLPIEVKEKNYDGKENLIKLAYFPNGQLKELLNASGRSLASQNEIDTTQRIYGTFQRVLEIIQPSGVSLSVEGTI
jgi:YD repeat-containing protein